MKLFILFVIFSQTLEYKLKNLKAELEKIREEKIKIEKEEKELLRSLELLKEEYYILEKFRKTLLKEKENLEEEIERISGLVENSKQEFKSSKEIIKKILVGLYKYGKRNSYNFLENQGTLLNFYTGYLAFKKGIEFRKKVLEKALHIKKELEKRKDILIGKIRELENIKRITEEKQKEIIITKREREELLRSIKKEKSKRAKLMRELEKQMKKLEKMLEEFHKKKYAKFKELPRNVPRKLFSWPLRGEIVSYYGNIWHPKYKTKIKNNGIDIRAKIGTKVRAAETGVVVYASVFLGYGKTVIIEHKEGFYTVYAGLGSIYVYPGEAVNKGEFIGEVGYSVFEDEPILHFEIRYRGKALNPLLFLPVGT